MQEPLGEIVEVVQAVERDEAIDAARHQPLNPESMDIERLKLEAERAAASRNDLERPLHVPAEQPDPIPWVVLEVADTGIEVDRAHDLERLEADPVHPFHDRAHHRGRHPSCPQALVPVPQGRIDELHLRHRAPPRSESDMYRRARIVTQAPAGRCGGQGRESAPCGWISPALGPLCPKIPEEQHDCERRGWSSPTRGHHYWAMLNCGEALAHDTRTASLEPMPDRRDPAARIPGENRP